MNIIDVEKDVQHREMVLKNLEYSLMYLKVEEEKNLEVIDLVAHEVFFVRDQLFNYKILLNLLRDESNEQMPQTNI